MAPYHVTIRYGGVRPGSSRPAQLLRSEAIYKPRVNPPTPGSRYSEDPDRTSIDPALRSTSDPASEVIKRFPTALLAGRVERRDASATFPDNTRRDQRPASGAAKRSELDAFATRGEGRLGGFIMPRNITPPDLATKSSLRGQYERHGAKAYYEQFGQDYRNPHESIIIQSLAAACKAWPLDLTHVLDLAAGSGEATLALRASAPASTASTPTPPTPINIAPANPPSGCLSPTSPPGRWRAVDTA